MPSKKRSSSVNEGEPSNSSSSNSKLFWDIEHSDVIRLMEAYMLEHGLVKSATTLREESGIGLRGTTHSNLGPWALTGQWGNVLQTMYLLDDCTKVPPAAEAGKQQNQFRKQHQQLLSDVHELAILDTAIQGDFDVAYAILKVCQQKTELFQLAKDEKDGAIPKYRLLEQRLAAVAADPDRKLPDDFFGSKKTTQQQRRLQVAQRLSSCVPRIPPNRLLQLLQQAAKWQAHTASWPTIRQDLYPDGDEEEGGVNDDDDDNNEKSESKPKKRKGTTERMDLVMGEVDYEWMVGTNDLDDDNADDDDKVNNKKGKAKKHKRRKKEKIPMDPWSTIKFGKSATCESLAFLPDASGLVTGSSDGLIEIWDPASKYTELRKDLDYQEKEELLGHDSAVTAIAVSRDANLLATGDKDGLIKVWRIDTGKCLRKFEAHSQGIASIAFSPNGTRVLSASFDGIAREFGLRTSRMLKEFQGHIASITTCQYLLDPNPASDGGDGSDDDEASATLQVVTGSGDGSVRIWSAHSAECVRIFQPAQRILHPDVASLVVDASALQDTKASIDSNAIVAVLEVSGVAGSTGSAKQAKLIVVSRSQNAYLVDQRGFIEVTYESDKQEHVMVAACLSPTQHSLFVVMDDGDCLVFDVLTGTLERTIREFALDSTSKSKGAKTAPEISGLVHHPHKGIMAAFSNDKSQKKGVATLWK